MYIEDRIREFGGDPFDFDTQVHKLSQAATRMTEILAPFRYVAGAAEDTEEYPPIFTERDIDKFVASAERELWQCCEALDIIRGLLLPHHQRDVYVASGCDGCDDGKSFRLCQSHDRIVVRTPRLRRLEAKGMRSKQDFRAPVMRLFADARPCKMEAQKINLYILSVYPRGITHYVVPDPDNVDVKMILDQIAEFVGIDDCGLDVDLHIMASETDDLPPASYAVVTPASRPILTKARLQELVSGTLTVW